MRAQTAAARQAKARPAEARPAEARPAEVLPAREQTADAPLILTSRSGSRREVFALNAVAQTAGLCVGMPATKAQALVRDLVIHDAEPLQDEEGLRKLALWALRYAPVVAADPPDGIIIDATGASHLHGGEAAML